MISLLKKRRKETSTEIDQKEVEQKQKSNEKQYEMSKKFWKRNVEKLQSNLYEDQKIIDIANHQEEFDIEKDVHLVPRQDKHLKPNIDINIINIDDSMDSIENDNIVVIDDESFTINQQFKMSNLPQNKGSARISISNQIQIGGRNNCIQEDERKTNDDQNNNKGMENNQYVQNKINERIKQIKNKQIFIEVDDCKDIQPLNSNPNPLNQQLDGIQTKRQFSEQNMDDIKQDIQVLQNNLLQINTNNIQISNNIQVQIPYNTQQQYSYNTEQQMKDNQQLYSNNNQYQQNANAQITNSNQLNYYLSNNLQQQYTNNVQIDNNLQIPSQNNDQVLSSINTIIKPQGESKDTQQNGVQVISDDEVEIEEEKEDPEAKVWFYLKSHRQTPIQFFADTKFKGQEKINLPFGKKYKAVEIFKKLFSQTFYTFINHNIHSKFLRSGKKQNGEHQQPPNINQFDIDAFMGLLMQFNCLNHPNLMNTMRTRQSQMDPEVFESICQYFSIGEKEDKSGNIDEMNKVNDFIYLVNQRFQQFLQPNEFLVISQKTIEGNDLKTCSEYHVDEFRLYDSDHQFILELKFDKYTPSEKLDKDHIQRMIRIQGDMLENFKNKSHKVIVLNQLFDSDILRSLRKQGIGVITKSSIENLQFTKKQSRMFYPNKLNKNFYFLYEREVCAVVTSYSFSQRFAFISNFVGLQKDTDLFHPKMQIMYNEKGVTVDHKSINQRDSEGVKWNLLVFIRIIDACVQNTYALYEHLNGKQKITKDILQQKLGRELIKQYHSIRELQQKITSQKKNVKGEVRIHLFKEIQEGTRKIECIVCKSKTKNYCEICTAKRKQFVGFCGSANCNEKHNANIVELFNEQVDLNQDDVQNLNTHEKTYDSGHDVTNMFRSKFSNLRNSDTSHNDFNVVRHSFKKVDGYQSEAQNTFKARNSSNHYSDANDGNKTDTGSSTYHFGKKKQNSQLFRNNDLSLGDQLLEQQRKKTISTNNPENNSQEMQLVDKNDQKVQSSERQNDFKKPNDINQHKSKSSLSTIDMFNSDKYNDADDIYNEQPKKKVKVKEQIYNENPYIEDKDLDKNYKPQFVSNPKVRSLLFQSDIMNKYSNDLLSKLERNVIEVKQISRWKEPQPQVSLSQKLKDQTFKASQEQNSQTFNMKPKEFQIEDSQFKKTKPKEQTSPKLFDQKKKDIKIENNTSEQNNNIFQLANSQAINPTFSFVSPQTDSQGINMNDQKKVSQNDEIVIEQENELQDKNNPSSLKDDKAVQEQDICDAIDELMSFINPQSKQSSKIDEKEGQKNTDEITDMSSKNCETNDQGLIQNLITHPTDQHDIINTGEFKIIRDNNQNNIQDSQQNNNDISNSQNQDNLINNTDAEINQSETNINKSENKVSDQMKQQRQVIRNIPHRRVLVKK